MLKINIRTKPVQRLRFKDVADYYFIISPVEEDKVLKITVAEMENPDYEFLVALHEFIESYLLVRKNTDLNKIDEWEERFGKERKEGKRPQNAIAGEQEDCPYKEEHKIATEIEKKMAEYLEVDWQEYDKYLEKLEENYD